MPSFPAAKVTSSFSRLSSQSLILFDISFVGAASDKVAALEKAGVIVTDSPAKIGATMLKVSAFPIYFGQTNLRALFRP